MVKKILATTLSELLILLRRNLTSEKPTKLDCEKLSIDFTSQYICYIYSYIRVRCGPYPGFVHHTDSQPARWTDGQTDRQTDTHTHTHTHLHTQKDRVIFTGNTSITVHKYMIGET